MALQRAQKVVIPITAETSSLTAIQKFRPDERKNLVNALPIHMIMLALAARPIPT